MHSTFGPYQHLYHSRKSYQCNTDVAFSADDSQIAVSEDGRLPSEHVMVWYKLKGDDLDEISGLLQIWKLRDHWMHVSSRHQHGHTSPTSCYSRNHDTRFILSTLLTHRNNHLMESSSHVVLTKMMMSESVIYGLVNSRQARYNARRP